MIPAFRGEFGLKVMSHVPRVYAMGPQPAIQIEEGEEALYPLAGRWEIVPRAHDDTRRGPPKLRGKLKRFVPTPHVAQDVPPADIVTCPRFRRYAPEKNWPHWGTLSGWLQGAGFSVFAAGAPDSSAAVPCDAAAWMYPRFLDASIQAMLSARLVIATDAGLAHLAVLCGRPLLIITADGFRVAPVTRKGARYWPVRFKRYYVAANHRNAPLRMVEAWEDPARVVEAAEEMMACQPA